jgi:hypothetical protein
MPAFNTSRKIQGYADLDYYDVACITCLFASLQALVLLNAFDFFPKLMTFSILSFLFNVIGVVNH